MRSSQLRWLRERMGLSVAELAERVGMDPQHLRQLERGFKYAGRQPVTISKTVELAVLAVHEGLSSFENSFPDQIKAEEDRPVVLTEREVPEPLQASALRKLLKRGIEVGPHRSFFLWETFLPFWSDFDVWCQDDREGIKLHPVLKRDQPGGGVAVVEFPTADAHFEFKMRWIGETRTTDQEE